MSKRFIDPEQQGVRKKQKLDLSISDHNFPLSRNSGSDREIKEVNNWGDDIDDEILLLASQACDEDVFSQLPSYSSFMQPASTSTQLNPQPGPSTSKDEFAFKKPTSIPHNAINTDLKEKCTGISSPLPGISSKVISKNDAEINVSDDLIINEKIFKNQDNDYVYRQLLQLQEENAKLKSENGKLLEKCVTKEGEASILRTQLKTCQMTVDKARLEKIKAQEKVQLEWTEKLAVANSQMHDLRTQLDFKNLEIISVKERCKKLESTKIKLTQVTVGNNDITTSHRNYNITQCEPQTKRLKTVSISIQTEDRALLLRLNKTYVLEPILFNSILPLILEPTTDHLHSILDYNEKLQKHTDLSHKRCRLYSTIHRVAPTTPVTNNVARKVTLSSMHEDVTAIAAGGENEQEKYFNIFNAISAVLNEVQCKLETISQRVTTSFQKEMDEKYIEVSLYYLDISREDLLKGRALYKEEQDILGRRMAAILSYVLEHSNGLRYLCMFEEPDITHEGSSKECTPQIIDIILRICKLLDNTCCATLYSGLLVSIAYVIRCVAALQKNRAGILDIIKTVLTSRPMPFVASHLLALVNTASLWSDFLKTFCPSNAVGNLKVDYEQGVLLYKRDSCYIQVLLKQIESCLKCIEKQNLPRRAVETTRNLIILHSNINGAKSLARDKSSCDCQLVLVQVIVYALRICAVMLDNILNSLNDDTNTSAQLLCACRCGIRLLYRCTMQDFEFGSQLAHSEGHLIEFCEIMRTQHHGEAYSNMLSELAGTLQSAPEDSPPSFLRQPWLESFQSFSIAD